MDMELGLFRFRTGSGGLMEDLKRCRRKSDARCVLCDEGVVEDIRHFLVECGEFENDRERLMEMVGPPPHSYCTVKTCEKYFPQAH